MQVSAFVDGELPEHEAELLIRRLSQDAEMRQLAAHYMEIGRSLRGDATVPGIESLRGRIAAELGEEAEIAPAEAPAVHNRFLKPAAGLGVAAAVAALAIVSLRPDAPEPQTSTAGFQTIPAAEEYLDAVFRHHDNGAGSVASSPRITELVDFELDQDDLIQVEPRVELISTTEVSDEEVEGPDEGGDDAESGIGTID